MPPIHPIVLAVSKVEQVRQTSVIGSGSGFFYSGAERLFLVTNKHVVKDEPKGVVPDKLRLILHTNRADTRQNAPYDVPLYGPGSQPLWKTHSRYPVADIALIELDKAVRTSFAIETFSVSSFLPGNFVLNPGEDVFITGYPLGFYDAVFNLPIFRNALIASTYGIPFRGNPLFLTDANLHPGMSGSPVVTKPKNTWQDAQGNVNMVAGTPYFLLGIHSGTYEITLAGGGSIPLGLGATWYAQLIEDIAQQP